ncbi:hypothetical protein D5086_002852 [Populus alba]|uniref:Uncharacterized protein n=1 Tax=Populus alba TaxID=43335 RepID=A0ACC4D4J1_POPAL
MSKRNVETRFTSSVVKDGPGDRKAAIFTYIELSSATSNFRAESFLGSGGFGAVYIESTGHQVVAVKKLDPLDETPDMEPLDWNTRMKIAAVSSTYDMRMIFGSAHDGLLALPLMKEHNFSKLADPLLRGKYPMSVLRKVIGVASMCLGENANLRPSSSEVVQAMDYLLSRKSEPKKARNYCVKWPEPDFTPSRTKMVTDRDLDWDHAVAEAKLWGEEWREKQEQLRRSILDDDNR